MEVKLAKPHTNSFNKELNRKQIRHLDMFNYLTDQIGIFIFNDQSLYFNQTLQKFSKDLISLFPLVNIGHSSTYI